MKHTLQYEQKIVIVRFVIVTCVKKSVILLLRIRFPTQYKLKNEYVLLITIAMIMLYVL